MYIETTIASLRSGALFGDQPPEPVVEFLAISSEIPDEALIRIINGKIFVVVDNEGYLQARG